MTDATDTMAQDLEALRRERDRLQSDRDAVADALRVPKHEGIATLVRIATEYREKFYKERERADALAAHVEQINTRANVFFRAWDTGLLQGELETLRSVIKDAPTTSLARRNADTASAVHRALVEGADLNNLRKAPTAEQAIDFILSLARVEAEKRRPMQIQASQAEGGESCST